MTAARADIAARELLGRLIDETELETATPDEVRADLALLGVDPVRAIRFCRQLAEQASSPAAGLLAKSLAAEDSDREIVALEQADPGTVRAKLSAAAPQAMLHAQRLASEAISQAGRRRRSRRLWYGIGGMVTALAASVLIAVNISNPDMESREYTYAPDGVVTDRLRSEGEGMTPSGMLEVRPQTPPPTGSLQAPANTAPPAKSAAEPASMSAEYCGTCMALPGPSDAARIFEQLAMTYRSQPASPIDPTSLKSVASSSSRGGVNDLVVTAALILQPERVPEHLRQSDIGAGDLLARLSEAARSPARQDIVALVTLRRSDGTTFDGMLLQKSWSFDREISTGTSDEAALAAPPLSVPESPTFGDLLGSAADQFALIEAKPKAVFEPEKAPQ